MKENQAALIDQTEKFINDQIKHLEEKNSSAAEKVFLRESQIKQTSSDLQDAYNRLVKQSQDECDIKLVDILTQPRKEFFIKAQDQIQKKFDHLSKETKNESDKIKIAEVSVEMSEKYILQFEILTKTLEKKIETVYSKINEVYFKNMYSSFQKLQKDNDQILLQYYQKQYTKLNKLENKNLLLIHECDKLDATKNEIQKQISQLSDNIICMAQKVSISIQNKEYKQFITENFVIINIEPACQKKKAPTGNLLVLAPIHSLTRQMKGTLGASRFFLKKNMF